MSLSLLGKIICLHRDCEYTMQHTNTGDTCQPTSQYLFAVFITVLRLARQVNVMDIWTSTDEHLLGRQVIAAAEVVQGAAALAPPHLRSLLPRAPHRQELQHRLP